VIGITCALFSASSGTTLARYLCLRKSSRAQHNDASADAEEAQGGSLPPERAGLEGELGQSATTELTATSCELSISNVGERHLQRLSTGQRVNDFEPGKRRAHFLLRHHLALAGKILDCAYSLLYAHAFDQCS
jgi:hypothetical protein